MEDIRIALVLSRAAPGQVRQNLGGMLPWLKEAKTQGAGIVCFPELNLSGYQLDADIGRDAEPVPGTVTRELQIWARALNLTILAGLMEHNSRGKPYASHLVIQPEGPIGIYRKLHIAPPEKPFFTPGQDIPLFNVRGITFGIQLCYDAHFPELATHLAQKGADLIFIPHASPRGTPQIKRGSWMRHLPARAFDNGLFVAAVNQVGENQTGLAFPGVALVIGPSGEVITEHLGREEALLVTDLKARDLERVRKHRMRYFLPHRRPDLYRDQGLRGKD